MSTPKTIPTQSEMTAMLYAMRDGKTVDERRILRGAVYHGALGQGYSKKDAFETAMSPELAATGVRFNIRME